MKTLLMLWMLGVLATGSVACAADAVAVKGEVVDLTCYLAHPETGHGSGHRKCAQTCAKNGAPVGLLTEDNHLFLLLGDHDNPKAYADVLSKVADTITVEGNKVTQDGLNGIVVQSVK
jgi:hypothetical protein